MGIDEIYVSVAEKVENMSHTTVSRRSWSMVQFLSINILVRQVNEVLININLIYKRPSYIVTCVSCFWF